MSGSSSLPPEDEQLLDELADAIVARGLATPALFLLESMHPLAFVGSQLMLVLRPMVALVGWARRWDQLQRVLEVRGSAEQLARKLEARQ